MQANERTDERVTQYLHLDSCLSQTTVRWWRPFPLCRARVEVEIAEEDKGTSKLGKQKGGQCIRGRRFKTHLDGQPDRRTKVQDTFRRTAVSMDRRTDNEENLEQTRYKHGYTDVNTERWKRKGMASMFIRDVLTD